MRGLRDKELDYTDREYRRMARLVAGLPRGFSAFYDTMMFQDLWKRGPCVYREREIDAIRKTLGSEWLPADWEIRVKGDAVTVYRPLTRTEMNVGDALALRDLLATTSRMVSEGRFGRRRA